MHTTSSLSFRSRQSGAALVIGLILLLTLTLLGVSSLNTATLDIRMADSVKQSRAAFEAAESALNADLRRREPLLFNGTENEGDQVNDEDSRPVFTYQALPPGGGDAVATATVTNHFRRANVYGTGSELGVGTGASMQVHFFSLATGTAERGAVSDQEVGFYVQAP